MSYFRLERRVPEASAVEPRLLTWLYSLITQVPLVRSVHQRFVAGTLAQGVTRGYGLDVGTGPGNVALEIARRQPGLQMVGLDLAAHMVERAHWQAVQAGLDGRGVWPQGDGHRLPFADGTFDLVTSSFALHHWDEPLQVLNEIARVLRRADLEAGIPAGRYCIADLCREVKPFHRLFAYASIPAVSLPFGSYLGYGGYYESLRAGYTRAEAQALLDRSDLPPGEVRTESTWFVPIVSIASRPGDGPGAFPDAPGAGEAGVG